MSNIKKYINEDDLILLLNQYVTKTEFENTIDFHKYSTSLSYIQNDGESFIDLEFKPNQDTKIICDCEIISYFGQDGGVFGARTDRSLEAFSFFGQYNAGLHDSYGVSTTRITELANVGRYLVFKNKNQTTINDTIISYDVQTFQCPYNVLLFAVNTGGGVDYQRCISRIYSCKIYDGNTLVRDLVPARNNFTDELGMLDKVNNIFYTNQGTGKLTGA